MFFSLRFTLSISFYFPEVDRGTHIWIKCLVLLRELFFAHVACSLSIASTSIKLEDVKLDIFLFACLVDLLCVFKLEDMREAMHRNFFKNIDTVGLKLLLLLVIQFVPWDHCLKLLMPFIYPLGEAFKNVPPNITASEKGWVESINMIRIELSLL